MTLASLFARDVDDDGTRLLARVAGGDERALRTLYDRHAGKLLLTARRLLGSAGEAEEIVQETFLDVWNRARTYDSERGSAATWILTIGRNRAIDRLRNRATRLRMHDRLQLSQREAALAPTPETAAEAAQSRRRMSAALNVLSPEQRIVVELAYYDGLSQSEIAARTGHPLGTVKGRARQALQRLAQLLDEGGA